ncbi:Homeodomain-like protein, partial [Cyathus striatus]
WQEIAKYVPGRSNKDCRKRWYNKMASPQATRGTWSPEEDNLLIRAVGMFGTNWSSVAAMVGTRKNCQCARRWYDALDPAIDKTPWTKEEEELLLTAVKEHGRKWSYISRTYFPRRTALATKNRCVQLPHTVFLKTEYSIADLLQS